FGPRAAIRAIGRRVHTRRRRTRWRIHSAGRRRLRHRAYGQHGRGHATHRSVSGGRLALAGVASGIATCIGQVGVGLTRLPAVFLNRDGALNGAVVRDGKPFPPASIDELIIMPDAVRVLGQLRAAGYRLVVVTNQPDVARGTQRREVVEAINAALCAALPLDDVFTCYDDGDSPRRKPNPGMLLEAAAKHRVDLAGSFLIGDRWKDVEAGRRAGCRTVLLDHEYQESRPEGVTANFLTRDIGAAADWVIAHGAPGGSQVDLTGRR